MSSYPTKYLQLNTQQSKPLIVVVDIDGVPNYYSTTDVYSKVKYGDPVVYGQPGLVYGALKRRTDVKSYMTVDSSMTISQKLEPEQGRASISTLQLTFIDKDGDIAKLCARNQIVDELMGDRQVRIYLGYQNSSFPEDYLISFRGVITDETFVGERATLTISDPNIRRRQDVFNVNTMTLASDVNDSQTNIPVDIINDGYEFVTGPDNTVDQNYEIFINVDSEYMKVTAIDVPTNTYTVVRNTNPIGISTSQIASHSSGTTVNSVLVLGTNETSPAGINAIECALKIMLSGWGGPWIENLGFVALGKTNDPLNPASNVVYLSQDADQDLGLVVGDYIIISGSSAGNDGSYRVTDIENDVIGNPNRLVYIDTALSIELPGTANVGIRSQFDTLPDLAGLQLKPIEVDVAGHIAVMNQFFSGTENNLQFEIESSSSGKSFIESQLFYPLSCYSLTRFGRLSVGYTRPPLPSQKLVNVSIDNVINPEKIKTQRSLTTRRFYNEVDFNFDLVDTIYETGINFPDLTSNELFGMNSVLPITADGMRSALGAGALSEKTQRAMLTRYTNAAFEVTLSVNWATGSVLEVGDVVVVTDEGNLKIPNFSTGERNIGTQLFEVINRALTVNTGQASLTLLSGIIDSRNDRYGTISPSSLVSSSGTSSSQITIKPSFGAVFGAQEFKKWSAYIGLKIAVHSEDYSTYEEIVLSDVGENILYLDGNLSFTPSEDYIVDVAMYSTSSDPNDQKIAKLLSAFNAPSVAVASGSTHFVFDVGSGDIAKFIEGAIILIHSADYGDLSPEAKITGIVGNAITVDTDLGFTPDNTQTVELIGFADDQGAYRFL